MVNIDTVYQRVLVLANKEQRGYITPQEFNLYANHAQMDIFEQYFYDINQFGRLPGNNTEYSDMLNYLEEKINIFEAHKQININAGQEFYNTSQIGNLYKIGSISYNNSVCEKVNVRDIEAVNKSPLLKPKLTTPIYVLKDNKIYVYPSDIKDSIIVNYIKKPKKVNWTYVVVGEKALYNTNAIDKQDFELHISEETKLVIKILQLAGITLKDSVLYQVAGTEDNKNIGQEKI